MQTNNAECIICIGLEADRSSSVLASNASQLHPGSVSPFPMVVKKTLSKKMPSMSPRMKQRMNRDLSGTLWAEPAPISEPQDAPRSNIERFNSMEQTPNEEFAWEYHDALHEAWKTVRDDPRFAGIATAEPPSIAQGGVMSPFDADDFKIALTHSGCYTCGINLAWLDLMGKAVPGRQIRLNAVHLLRDELFANPRSLPLVHVAVPGPTFAVPGPQFDVKQHKGQLI